MKNILYFALAITLCLSLTGSQAKAEPLKELNMSYVTAPFNLPSIVARKLGMWEKEFSPDGIEIKFHKITSGSKQAQAMAGGSLDICGVINSTSVLLANSAGNQLRIIAGYSRPAELFAIMAKSPDIKTIEDLKGKKIAGPKGTVLHQLLVAALASKGLGIKDVEFIFMKVPAGGTALVSDKVDAALLAASLVLNAQKAGAHIVTTAQGLVSPKLVMATSEKFNQEHPEIIERVIKVHESANRYVAEHTEEALKLGAMEHGVSLEEARYLYEHTSFITKLEGEDLKSMAEDMDFLIANGMLKTKVDLGRIVLPMALK